MRCGPAALRWGRVTSRHKCSPISSWLTHTYKTPGFAPWHLLFSIRRPRLCCLASLLSSRSSLYVRALSHRLYLALTYCRLIQTTLLYLTTMTRTMNYSGVNPRVRGPGQLAPIITPSQAAPTLPSINELLNRVPSQRVKQERSSLPGSPIATGLNGLSTPSSTYGHMNAQASCVECGASFLASLLQTRCDRCIAASQASDQTLDHTLDHTLDTHASLPTPRSSSDEEPVFYWQQAAARRASDPATFQDRRSSSVRSFWSPRVGTPSDGRSITDTGNPRRTSRLRQNRVGKAKREAESRSKQGEKLKMLENLILASEYRSLLTDTPALNSSNAQKSGLTYRKEVVLDVAIHALASRDEKIPSTTMLLEFVSKAKSRISPEAWVEAGLLEDMNKLCAVCSRDGRWHEPAAFYVQGRSSKL
ncbi:uncharacterized protein BDZ99DRAFT_498716 [Mytilinidion resinicola]|uniref:Uncharacterized protein n=1 Tax=Mytilinidion resinicola TaxID=574789 RepID=A0A6A6YKJ8_9PEZI|nr:uncharacterized protein BDZ99DRAFT_498716 [Mytilinidion resinicola]KAF2809320.1 hypothetical protein BDZ99DRAFT_498716 [Mytilinidion resinicola]